MSIFEKFTGKYVWKNGSHWVEFAVNFEKLFGTAFLRTPLVNKCLSQLGEATDHKCSIDLII